MIRDRVGDTVFQDTKLFKRGMVIDAHPDGWAWGKLDLGHPDFRILKCPAMDENTALSMLSAEIGFADADYETSTLQIRSARFDVDNLSLPADFRAFVTDDTRASGYYVVGEPVDADAGAQAPGILSLSALLAVRALMQPVHNPLMLAPDETIL